MRPNYTLLNYALVTSSILLTESHPVWTVDSRATDHIACDRNAYVEYHRISQGSRWIYVGNNSRVEAKGIGTYKLTLHSGRILLLHDVLYAPEIRRNLIYVHVLLKLGYYLTFHGVCLEIFLNSVFIGTRHLINGFIVVDTILNGSSYDNIYFSYVTSSSNNEIDAITWHARLYHIGQEKMYRLARKGMLGPLTKIELPICENYLARKTTKKPFSKGIRAENHCS